MLSLLPLFVSLAAGIATRFDDKDYLGCFFDPESKVFGQPIEGVYTQEKCKLKAEQAGAAYYGLTLMKVTSGYNWTCRVGNNNFRAGKESTECYSDSGAVWGWSANIAIYFTSIPETYNGCFKNDTEILYLNEAPNQVTFRECNRLAVGNSSSLYALTDLGLKTQNLNLTSKGGRCGTLAAISSGRSSGCEVTQGGIVGSRGGYAVYTSIQNRNLP